VILEAANSHTQLALVILSGAKDLGLLPKVSNEKRSEMFRFAKHDRTMIPGTFGAQCWGRYIQKRQEKRCFPCDPKRVPAACGERRRDRMKFIRAILIMAVLATALSFGACAQRKETVTTGAGTTGYAK